LITQPASIPGARVAALIQERYTRRGEMPKKIITSYPYKIPAFTGDPSKVEQCPPIFRYEYFFIEALLRNGQVMRAYKDGLNLHADKGDEAKRKVMIDVLGKYGIYGQDPLLGTHHYLLTAYSPETGMEGGDFLGPLGYIDQQLGILDLGLIAKLPRDSKVTGFHSTGVPITSYGPKDGMADCIEFLRSKNPRFLCLRIDLDHSPTLINKRLFSVFRERRAAYRRISQSITRDPMRLLRKGSPDVVIHTLLHDHIRTAKPFARVKAWLRSFECYDRYTCTDETFRKIGEDLFMGKDRDPIKARDAAEKAYQRARDAIQAVGTHPWPPV
jgi:hypothetical protein